MGRLQGVLHMRKNEYQRYQGLLELQKLKQEGKTIPIKLREKYGVPLYRSRQQILKRRIRIFRMVLMNKYKRKLRTKLQLENKKQHRRFDHPLDFPEGLKKKIARLAVVKANGRFKRDRIREKKKERRKKIKEHWKNLYLAYKK